MIKKVIIISIALLFFMLLVFAWMEYHRIKTWQMYEKRATPPPDSALLEREMYFRGELEKAKLRSVGRYQTFRAPESASIFLLDTIEGKIWVLVRDPKTKKLSWQRLEVEGEKEEEKRKIERQ